MFFIKEKQGEATIWDYMGVPFIKLVEKMPTIIKKKCECVCSMNICLYSETHLIKMAKLEERKEDIIKLEGCSCSLFLLLVCLINLLIIALISRCLKLS